MKKTLLIVALVLAALAVFSVGVVFAQSTQPLTPFAQGYGPGMMGGRGGRGGMMGGANGQYGPMHDYVEEALADKLGLTEAQIEEQLTAGKTMYQIAVDAGTAEADVPALLSEVHKTAFDKAVAAGVMTQQQADFMFQRMSQNGFGENCPMGDADGQGFGPGRGGMMGGRWQQNQQTQP